MVYYIDIMARITAEGLEEIFNTWNEVVVRPAAPEPLSYSELRGRLRLPSESGAVTTKSLLDMAEAVIALPEETEDLPLIQASYYWLVRQNAPWATKNK
jgi:hypothetical protein